MKKKTYKKNKKVVSLAKKPIKSLKHGLLETPVDNRDFKLGSIVRLPKLAELPESFRLETLGVKDQGQTDFCTAFSTDLLSEMQEGKTLCPEWGFATSKYISGDVSGYGQDLRTALKRHVEYGSLPYYEGVPSLVNQDSDFLRDMKNWPINTFDLAKPQKKKSYFKVSGQYDSFDNVKASIWKFRGQKQGVVIGIVWQWPLADVILHGYQGNGFGHAIAIIGWTAEGLLLQNSAGLEAGDKGTHILPRAEANYFIQRYGAYMMVDLEVDGAKYMMEHGIKMEDNVYKGLAKAFINVFLPFLRLW
jgi:hypothetical protein